MNKKWIAILPILFSISAHAALLGNPFLPEEDTRFDNIEGNASFNASSGLHQKQIAVANFVFSSAAGSTITAPFTIPAKATIVRSYLWVKTTPVGAGASIAIKCQNAGNILATTAVSSFVNASLPMDGVSTGASTLFKDITTACSPIATVTAAPVTAGNVTAYLEYILHN